MNSKLKQIRKTKDITSKFASARSSAFILLSSIALGAFSKWLDNLSLDSTIWWHRFLGAFDLRNVFSEVAIWLLLALIIAVFSYTPIKAGINTFLFFAGVCVSYHLYTVFFSGFNPVQYMMIWYAITLFSPVLAMICWYGKGTSIISIVIDALILAVLAVSCFSIGWFYFGINRIINVFIFIAAVFVLYRSPKQIIVAGVIGMVLSYLISPFIPF